MAAAATAASSFHPLLLFLLLLPPLSIAVQTNITLGSSLSTDDPNTSWFSPSRDFAFGFRRLPNTDTFLLAISFQKVPNKTIVWYANGGNPAPQGSNLRLNDGGSLILSDPQGVVVWTAVPPSGTTATSAAMFDTGNFALLALDSSVVWDTFGKPTDTILPSQVLPLGSQLSSHLTDSNYSAGRFLLRVQADGNLVMYPLDLVTGSQVNDAYWATNTVGSGHQLVFNASTSYIYLTRTNASSISISSENLNMHSPEDYYHRATLDSDGGFRHYIYPKNGLGAASWAVVNSVPDDLCTALMTQLVGGMCGYNSLCQLDDAGRPNCTCLPGYSYMDPAIPGLGCKPSFAPQSCGSDPETGTFVMREIVNVNWPLGDFEKHWPMNEEQCKENCLNDCFCGLAIFGDGSCWKKNLPMLNGRVNVGSNALVKVPGGNFSSGGAGKETGRSKEDRGPLVVVGSLLGVSGFLNLAFFLATAMVLFSSGKNPTRKAAAAPDSGMPGTSLRSFTYNELVQVTNGFKEELGSGAFGTVYKGTITSCDSAKPVAVKNLNRVLKDGDKEFIAEVSTIGRTHHRNLVQLLGFCQEGSSRLLVYEFMSNGSLADFLFQGRRPAWNLRMQIACGIARGIMYLHEDCESQIIHCDIKPHNILLDEHFTARIADFGLAKLMETDHSRTYTSIRGTRGYVAPEWFRKSAVSVKVDVYSFGVMLLEIICCRKNVEVGGRSEHKAILTDWACDCYKEGKLGVLVEGDEEALSDQQRLERAVIVAIRCIQEDPALRPSMKMVTQMLEDTTQVCVPPDLSSFSAGYRTRSYTEGGEDEFYRSYGRTPLQPTNGMDLCAPGQLL